MPDLDLAGSIAQPLQVRGRTIFGYDPGTGQLIPVQVTGAGAVVTSSGPPTPLTTLGPTPIDTAVGAFATVPLPVGPAGTVFQVVQAFGAPGYQMRVRELGGAAGAGIILPVYAVAVFDGGFALEVEDMSGLGGRAIVTWES